MNDVDSMVLYDPSPVAAAAASSLVHLHSVLSKPAAVEHRIPAPSSSSSSAAAAAVAGTATNQHQLFQMLQRITQAAGSSHQHHHHHQHQNVPGNFSILGTIWNQSMLFDLLNRTDVAAAGGSSSVQYNVHTDAAATAADDDIQQSLWIKVLFYIVYVVICLLGIAGNLIVCYVVARKAAMHTVTNVFIANLALSDILLCLFAVPFTPLYLITFKSWIFGSALCRLVPFAQGISLYISTLTLMSIAIDRYFVILLPFKPRMQMRTCILIILAIWVLAIILTFPYAHFMKFEEIFGPDNQVIYYCSESLPYGLGRVFAITTPVIQFVIPFLIITLCYVKICAKLWDRAKTIPGNVSVRREEQERERTRKTNRMLISMVIIFVVSWLPLNVFNLLMDFYEGAAQWPYQNVLFLISHAIAMSSTCYNPFLYAWLNDNFRKEFKAVLPCCFALCRTNTMPTLVELKKNQNATNSNDHHNHHHQQNNSSATMNNSNNDAHNRQITGGTGTGTGSSKKFIQLCSSSNKDHRVTCEISVDKHGGTTAIIDREMEEARQSLISKNKCMVRYDGGRQFESVSVGTHNSSSSAKTSSSQINESNHCEP